MRLKGSHLCPSLCLHVWCKHLFLASLRRVVICHQMLCHHSTCHGACCGKYTWPILLHSCTQPQHSWHTYICTSQNHELFDSLVWSRDPPLISNLCRLRRGRSNHIRGRDQVPKRFAIYFTILLFYSYSWMSFPYTMHTFVRVNHLKWSEGKCSSHLSSL